MLFIIGSLLDKLRLVVVGVTAPNQDIDDVVGNFHIDRLAIYKLVHSRRPVVKPLRGARYKPAAISQTRFEFSQTAF